MNTKNTFEEWKEGDDGSIVSGIGFKIFKDDRIVSEYINIRQRKDQIIYEARLPHSAEMVEFNMIQVRDGGFFCENSDFDFPKRISYELEGYETLHVILFGTRRKVEFKFRKVK